MRELSLAMGIFALLAGGAFVLQTTRWETLGWAGAALVVLGLVCSVPCALWYHVLLWRHLAPRGRLERGWIWNPVRQHAHLTPAERDRVLPWFYAGAAGWGATMFGCALIGLAAWLARG